MKTATLKRIIASVTAVTICSLGIFITPWLGIGGTDAHADGEVTASTPMSLFLHPRHPSGQLPS